LLFKNITVLRADGTMLENVNVAVKDGRFFSIGKELPWGEWDSYDGSGRLLMPGMVNAHTHVPMTLMRGYGDDMQLDRWLFDRIFPFEDKLTGEDVYWGSLLGIAEMLASGTTSFSDMYYFCDRIAQAVIESGIKANIGRGISCFDKSKRFNDLPAFHEMSELIDSYHGEAEGRVLIDAAPHSEYTTRPDILSDVADFAASRNLRVQLHLSETNKEQLECVGRHGKTPTIVMKDTGLLNLPVTAAHCVWLSDIDMEVLAECGVNIAHCPQSNLKLASGIARVDKMKKLGLNVALGTDSAASNNNLDMIEEMRTAALLAKGITQDPCVLPAGDALYMATRAGALSQGRTDCGDILDGYRADFVVLNLNSSEMTPNHSTLSNVVYASCRSNVEMTVVDGHVLYCKGEYLTMDIERIMHETAGRVNSMLAR
jgi:5-methylthioadenosine/S-adenosylhomocysteine deaminase